jgi:hypothetical protein
LASGVTYWQLPDEEADFFRYLAEREVVAIRHMEAVADPAVLRPVPVCDLIGRADESRLFLTVPEVVSEPLPLKAWEPASPGEPVRYSLPYAFPAVMYDAGTLLGGRVSQTHASALPAVAPTSVAAWMRRVFGWLRRATPHWHEYPGYRVTDRAAEAALAGLVLTPYHGWSGNSTGRSSFAPRRGA